MAARGRDAGSDADPRIELRQGLLVTALIVMIAVPTAVFFASDSHSPLRVAFALAFVLLVPGLAVTELLELRDPVVRLAIAPAASTALGTLVAVVLLYAGAYSAGRAFVVLCVLTVVALAPALLRAFVRVRAARPIGGPPA